MLFVGGCADGRWIDVPRRQRIWKVAEQESCMEAPEDYMGDASLASEAYEVIIYERKRLRGENMEFSVMAVEGTSADELIATLIDGYLGGHHLSNGGTE